MKSVVPVVPEQEPCLYCDGGDRRNERLISCKDCKTTVHPSCLNYPEDLTDQIYSQVLPLHHLHRTTTTTTASQFAQPWQCINCKVCSGSRRAGHDVSSSLFSPSYHPGTSLAPTSPRTSCCSVTRVTRATTWPATNPP